MFTPIHQHLLVKCTIKKTIKEVEVLNQWFRDLVTKVGMKVVAGPTSVMVDEPGNEGLTGTVTLATSHASIHIWDEGDIPFLQFDIYSCKCYETSVVLDHINNAFGINEYEYVLIDRNDNIKIVEQKTGKY
jgi:S-adenosylmethionine/arginine decarboxylase-like enzyme